MKHVVVIGAGRIGSTIAHLLVRTEEYTVTITDRQQEQLDYVDDHTLIQKALLDVGDDAALTKMLKGSFAVLSAAPFHLTTKIARAAAQADVHYLDLTEDIESTRQVKDIAAKARTAFVPQCGLAPGFVSIITNNLAGRFDKLESVRMRVGALPQYPSNALGYNLTWSVDGLINEYIKPCEAIVDGRLIEVPALEGREEFSLDGVTYEAFNTSGGLGSLCETMLGKVQTLNYRTIRYPGHVAIMKTLLGDLGLRNRPEVLKDIFEKALPVTDQDVVVVFVTVSGYRKGRLTQETYAHKIYSQMIDGRIYSAIQISTAASICTVLDLIATEALPGKGFIRQEAIALDTFLANRFGKYYAQ